MSAHVQFPGRSRGPTTWLILGLAFLVAACGAEAAGPAGQPDLSVKGGSVGSSSEGANPQPAVGGAAPAARDDARIIRTGSMQLQVKDVSKAIDAARTAVTDLGGYISASRQSTADDGSVVAEITYRIPVDKWENTLSGLRGLALKVLGEQTEAVEVTGQVIDLDARIRNLQASERALQGIAERATAIKDVLEVQSQLTEVRGQIEQLTAQKGDLVDRAALGTMAVTFGVALVAVTEAAKGWNAATEVDRAAASLVDVLQAVATAGIWFGIVWLPILIVLLILALVVRIVLRRTGLIDRAAPVPVALPPDAGAG